MEQMADELVRVTSQLEMPGSGAAVAVPAPGLEGSGSVGRDGHVADTVHAGTERAIRGNLWEYLSDANWPTCPRDSILGDQNAHRG